MLIVVKLLLIYAVLVATLWLLSLFLFNYLYTEPAAGLTWRVPAAGAIVVLLCLAVPLGIKRWTSYDVPVTLGHVFLDTTPERTVEFDRVTVNIGGREEEYRRERGGLGPNKFISADRRRFPPEAAEFMAITKDGRRISFRALRDPNGYLQRGSSGVIYVSEEGYRLEAGELGRIELRQPGGRVITFLVLLLGLASWIGALLLIQFNPGHAISLGIGLYAAWLFIMGYFF